MGNPEAEGKRNTGGVSNKAQRQPELRGEGDGVDPHNTCAACPWHSEHQLLKTVYFSSFKVFEMIACLTSNINWPAIP